MIFDKSYMICDLSYMVFYFWVFGISHASEFAGNANGGGVVFSSVASPPALQLDVLRVFLDCYGSTTEHDITIKHNMIRSERGRGGMCSRGEPTGRADGS